MGYCGSGSTAVRVDTVGVVATYQGKLKVGNLGINLRWEKMSFNGGTLCGNK